MSRRQKIALGLICLLLALLLLWREKGRLGFGPAPVTPTGPGVGVSTSPAPGTVPSTSSLPSPSVSPITQSPAHKIVPHLPTLPIPAPTIPPVTPPITPPVTPPVTPITPLAPAQEEGLHKELIPRNITIVRCYYELDVVAPGTTFGFDINGSGFTEAFHQMITVDFDALDVEALNLRLVTANQIHGDVQVGPDATTQYIYPKVLIRNLPVFKASDPFGVVRHGEILDIQLTSIDETGQSGRFRMITNFDRDLYKRLRIEPTDNRLEVGELLPQLPFYVDGTMAIAPGLHSGEYGLTASLGSHELFKKNPLVDVVRPNIGRTGSIENVKAVQPIRRPGDTVEFTLTGSGFTPTDATTLSARVDGLATEPAKLTFVSAGRLQILLMLPTAAPVGMYGVTILQNNKSVHQRKTAFAIVPPNWLGSVLLPRPLGPGQSGTVQITGRDLAPDFVQGLRVQTDDPGLQLSNLHLQDPSTIAMDVRISTDVASGDYLVHVFSHEKALQLPGGQIIKITR
jgi:hypothetical protein